MNARPNSPERIASDLRVRHGEVDPPIDVERIARAEGADIVRDRLEADVSGLLLRAEGRTVIVVNDRHHPNRQRFTISHEIGHLLLHPGRAYTVDATVRLNWRNDLSGLASDKEEIQANKFAATLLMPADLIRRSLDELGAAGHFGDERALNALAKEFDVSVEAMNFRLINLGIAV